MKRTASLVLCLLLVATLLVACAEPQPPVHTHEFASAWSKNASVHWHAATCDHNVQSDMAAHVGTEEDGICDTCGYEEHDHTYAEAWSSNAWGHWLEATCECDARKDAAAHVDENLDGACDTCAYDAGHIHAYATAWTADETGHWHASACGHDVKADFAAHTANDAGYCSVCNAKVADVTVETIADAIKVATAQAGLVKNGSFFRHNISEWSDSVTNATYAFGDGYLYIIEDDGYSATESWYSLDANGEVFCVCKADGVIGPNPYEVTEDNLNGYGFNLDFTNLEGVCYGAEAFLAALYEEASANNNGDFTESVYDGVYSFSFGVNGWDGWYLNQVTVEFTLTENYVLNDLTVINDRYINEEENDTFTADENGYLVLNDPWAAVPTFSYEINLSQNGELGKNPYPAEEMIATDFNITAADGSELGETLNLTVGNTVYLPITNIAPATAMLALDTFTFDYGSENYELSVMYTESNDAFVEGDYIMISAYKAGTYTLKISSTNVEKTITVVVEPAMPTEIYADVWCDDYGYDTFVTKSEATLILGSSLYFGASVDNDYADADYTAVLTGDNAANATIVDGAIDYYGSSLPCSVFTATALGTYTVEITSTVVDTVKTTLTITVVEAPELPSADELLNGTYVGQAFSGVQLTVTFTPASEGATNGTVVVKQVGYRGAVSGTETYAYDYADGVITLTHVSGDELGLVLSTDGMILTATVVPYGAAMPDYTEDVELALAQPIDLAYGMWTCEAGYMLDLGEWSSAFITDSNYSSVLAFSFELEEGEDGNYYFSFVEDTWSSMDADAAKALFNFADGCYMTADASAIVLVMADGSTVTFTK